MKTNNMKTRSSTKTVEGNTKTQTFSYASPTAMSVRLAGDFTHWQQEAVSMKKQRGGIWKTTVKLTPGTHHYRFIVDGNWCDDPECTLRVPNPYGSANAVRQVA